jgi:hypothetical protein
MNIPSFVTIGKRITVCALLLLTLVWVAAAQTAEAAYDIDQCANGKRGDPREACTGANWVNGNLNESKSQYSEGDSVAFRIKITGLVPNSTGNTVTIGYDPTKAGKSAYDYLTTWDRTETGDPCNAVATCNLGIFDTETIPTDPRAEAGFDGLPGTSDDITQIPGVFTLFGGTGIEITGVSGYTLLSGSYASDSTKSITITFKAGNNSTAVLAWGGHIADRHDWGINNAAPDISGSPYHMRSLNGGNQDRSLKIPIAAFPAELTIIKMIGDDDSLVSDLVWAFHRDVIGLPGPADFFLQDNGVAPPGDTFNDRVTFKYQIANSASSPLIVNVDETTTISGWSISDINCVDADGGFGFTADSRPFFPGFPYTSGNRAIAKLQAGEFVTCTFQNTRSTSTAAPASVGGRVVNSLGRGVSGVTMTLTDLHTGEVRTATSNSFGYYRMDNVSTEAFYSLTATSKRYIFMNETQYFTLSGDNLDLNFTSR